MELSLNCEKVWCVFPMAVVSILSHAEFGRNGHRENAPLVVTDQVLGGPEKGRLVFMNNIDYS